MGLLQVPCTGLLQLPAAPHSPPTAEQPATFTHWIVWSLLQKWHLGSETVLQAMVESLLHRPVQSVLTRQLLPGTPPPAQPPKQSLLELHVVPGALPLMHFPGVPESRPPSQDGWSADPWMCQS